MQTTVKNITGVCVLSIIVMILLGYGLGKNGFFTAFLNTFQSVSDMQEHFTYLDQAYEELQNRKPPEIKADNRKVEKGVTYAVTDFVFGATDTEGNNLLDSVQAEGDCVDEDGFFTAPDPGAYILTFTVYDSYGKKGESTIVLIAE